MEGYAKLATLMGAFPEVAIIRRFAALNTQNVLYLQAELIDLESRLRKYERDDEASGDLTRAAHALNWYKLRSSALSDEELAVNTDGEAATEKSISTQESADDAATEKSTATKKSAELAIEGERWRTMLQAREKLKEYNEAVLRQVEIAKLQKPNPRDLRFLKEWLDRPDMGGVYLTGQDSDVWENPDRFDLMAVKARHNESMLSLWMSDWVIHWYHLHIGRHLQKKPVPPALAAGRLDSIAQLSGTSYHSQSTVLRIARVFGMTLASLLPVASIVVLYFVTSMPARLGIIGGFTATFSTILGIVTNGQLIDIFAASAAYAAVQVVFIGSTASVNGAAGA